MNSIQDGHELPQPSEEARTCSAQLQRALCDEAAADPMPFSRYMHQALYAPGLGYYSGGSEKFGAAGDFVTAPESSPLFGACVARQCAQVLQEMDGADVLELGAGSGALAAQVLSRLEALDCLPEHYYILEVSASLRARQQSRLDEALPLRLRKRLKWLDRLPESPIQGVMLANEVMDALPVERFQRRTDGVMQLMVECDAHAGLRPHWRSACDTLSDAVQALEADLDRVLEPGYQSEFCPNLPAWLASLAEVLDRGVLLLIDYGYGQREYYHPQRAQGTLVCHYRHRAHFDPFRWPGLQDISAFVDFTACARAAESAQLTLAGYTTQAHFLIGCGLEHVMQEVAAQGLVQQLELARQAKMLTMPGEMGERFKAMALTRGFVEPLRGFQVRDLRGSL